jgi:hypothetical protein
MNPGSSANALTNRKVFRLISHTLVFLMMVCVVMTIGNLIQLVLPHWHSGIIVGILLFIVVDRLYTYRQLKSLTPLSSEWAMAVGAQWILIVLVIRFLLSYADGLDAFRADLSLFARGYLAELFTGEFIITLLLAILIWYLPAQFLALLDEIGLDQERASREELVPIESGIVPAHQRLVSLLFSLGIGLVILTVLTRINLRTVLSNVSGFPSIEISRFSGGEAGALLYFVFGLTLLSLSRLMSLQTHWYRQRIPVSSGNLTRQWGKYSLWFLFTLAVIVSLLPAGDSLGLFPVLGALLGFLIGVFFFIAQLLLTLIVLLFSLPLILFGQGVPFMSELPPPPPLPSLPIPSSTPPPPNAAWTVIRSVLLWGSLIAIAVFAIVHFVRQHEGIRGVLRRSRVTNWLLLAWQWLYRSVDKTTGNVSRALASGWQGILSRLEGRRILPRVDFIRLRSLDARQQIYFFYLAMVRRGGEQGVSRQPSQTPSEYAVQLEKALPSAIEDIDSITEAFVEARYSRQDVDAKKADVVKGTWGRIRRAFQEKSKTKLSSNR